jgi:1,5-anhydro-D-fructose reductase (1,5-anhydro-D-mannitol-forming)
MTADDRLGWGFIGASAIAEEWMAPAVQADPGSRLAAVMSRDIGRARALAARHGIPHAYADVAALLADPAVDIVYISSANQHHHGEALLAAAAGKHLLCEKPLALSLAAAAEMVEACRRHRVVMGTNHHLRNAAIHQALRRQLREGAIGRPLAVRLAHAVHLPPALRTWRVADPVGGGAILDIGVHDVDLLRFLLGREPVEAVALAGSCGMAAEGIEDSAMAVLRMDDGLLATMHMGYAFPASVTRLEIEGEAGLLIARDALAPRPVGTLALRRDGREEPVPVTHENLYAGAVRRFAAAVRSEGSPAATGQDGVRSLAGALAIREAAATGRAVRIPA